jgi:hypothetical protein
MKTASTEQKRCSWESDLAHGFVLNDVTLTNLYELIDALETMSDETFRHHVNPAKNDFAQWVQDVFSEHTLAHELRSCATAEANAQTIVNHIVTRI